MVHCPFLWDLKGISRPNMTPMHLLNAVLVSKAMNAVMAQIPLDGKAKAVQSSFPRNKVYEGPFNLHICLFYCLKDILRFWVIQFLLHSAFLLLNFTSSFHSITLRYKSSSAASNGFTPDLIPLPLFLCILLPLLISLVRVLGVIQNFAKCFMLHCIQSNQPFSVEHTES